MCMNATISTCSITPSHNKSVDFESINTLRHFDVGAVLTIKRSEIMILTISCGAVLGSRSTQVSADMYFTSLCHMSNSPVPAE